MEAITSIESRLNEADACRSMQLLQDSLHIYEGVLATLPPKYTACGYVDMGTSIRI